MSQNYEALITELRADIKGFQASLQTAAGSVRRFESSASADVDKFQTSILRARGAVIGLAAAWGAFRIGKGIVDAGVQIEAMRNKMAAATGSAVVAADSLAFVRSEANRLGLDIRTTSDGFAGFAASSLRAGLTLQQTKEIFTGVSEAATSMRLPTEQVSLIFKALEQMAGKGVVSMEELCGQLGDALPGAFEIAAKAMGKGTAEFSKMVANGEVLSADFLPKFGAAVRKELGGSVDEASRSAQAAFNRLGNAFFDMQTQMANSGFLDVVTKGVQDLTATLNDPATIEGLKTFAALLADAARVALEAAASVGDAYREFQKFGDKAFGAVFGEEGAQSIALARRAKASGLSMDSQKMVDDYLSKGGLKFGATGTGDSGGLSSENGIAGSAVSGNYSLGTTSKPVDPAAGKAAAKAAKQAAALREQLSQQVESLRYQFASPEQKAGMDVESQQDTLKKALDAKAITEQEYRNLSLEAELDYQDRLKEIRDSAQEDELSALEGFLGAKMQTQQQMKDMSLADQAKGFRETISQAAQHNRTFFAIEKAAALARATIAAYESVVTAYAFGSRIGGPPLGAVFAGVAAAAQAVNISALASTSFNGGGGGSIGSSSGGGGGGDVSMDTGGGSSSAGGTGKTLNITLVGDQFASWGKNQIRELIDLINDAQADGSRVLLVGA